MKGTLFDSKFEFFLFAVILVIACAAFQLSSYSTDAAEPRQDSRFTIPIDHATNVLANLESYPISERLDKAIAIKNELSAMPPGHVHNAILREVDVKINLYRELQEANANDDVECYIDAYSDLLVGEAKLKIGKNLNKGLDAKARFDRNINKILSP